MAAADKADRGHARRGGGGHASRRILDHDAVAGLNAHPRRCMQEQVGRGLAVRHVAGGKQAVEEPREAGGLQAHPDAVAAARTKPRISVRAAKSAHARRAAWRAVPRAGASMSPPRRWRRNARAACGGSPPRWRRTCRPAGARRNSAVTSSGVIGIPTRVSSSAATAAAICSLSTSTPLQSKMITEPAPRAPSGSVAQIYAVRRITTSV